jgi:hypothetical protein
MKAMTLRGVDPELESRLKQAARENGKSVNQVVLEALRTRFGLDRERRFTHRHHDLDHLFGRWDESQFQEIQSRLDAQRRIDAELWP